MEENKERARDTLHRCGRISDGFMFRIRNIFLRAAPTPRRSCPIFSSANRDTFQSRYCVDCPKLHSLSPTRLLFHMSLNAQIDFPSGKKKRKKEKAGIRTVAELVYRFYRIAESQKHVLSRLRSSISRSIALYHIAARETLIIGRKERNPVGSVANV